MPELHYINGSHLKKEGWYVVPSSDSDWQAAHDLGLGDKLNIPLTESEARRIHSRVKTQVQSGHKDLFTI